MANDTYAGPIDYALFVLPGEADAGPALQTLFQTVESGAIELLDLEVLGANNGGPAIRESLTTVHHDLNVDLSIFDGVETDILDEEDLELIGADLKAGEYALVVVYEDRSLAKVAELIALQGGAALASGGVNIEALEAVLDLEEEPS